MSPNGINFLFLCPLFVIGAACTYTDIKYGKILNKWVIFGLIYVFFLYVFLFLYEINISYIFELILNGTIAFLIGYLLWHFKLWSAGDAKLFAVYAFLIPLHFYSKSYVPYFPSFNLLVNLFIPLLFVLIISALITALKEGWRLKYRVKNLKFSKIKKAVQLSMSLFWLFPNYLFTVIILQLSRSLIENSLVNDILANPFFIFALLFLIRGYLNKKAREKKWLTLIIYGVILGYIGMFIILGDMQRLVSILSSALIFIFLVKFIHNVLEFYINKKQVQKIKIKDIQEGMILVKNKALFIFKKLEEKIEEFGVLDPGGLKKNQAELIKILFQENEEAEVEIHKTFPFAPFLLLSAIISISTQSSFLFLFGEIYHQ